MTTTHNGPVPRPSIGNIAAYVPGDAGAADDPGIAKLSANETPLGPSPAAREAFRACADQLALYPDGSAAALRRAIARRYGLDPDRIVCGAGSDELLNLLANAYLGPGDEAIYSAHGFLVYRIAILASGATPVVAPETALTASVDAILASVTDRTRVVFLANPNNPTGTYVPIDEVRRLRASLPPHVLLILDAAYAEYVARNDYEAGIEMVATGNNTVMTRTFSKVYGLAALRLGWLYGPASVVDTLNRIRGPFNVASPAIAAGVAAVADDAHTRAAVAHNDQWRPWLAAALTDQGLDVTPSVGNFLLIHFDAFGPSGAAEADTDLRSQGIIVRRVTSYGFPNALRISIGTESENKRVAAALAEFCASKRSEIDRASDGGTGAR